MPSAPAPCNDDLIGMRLVYQNGHKNCDERRDDNCNQDWEPRRAILPYMNDPCDPQNAYAVFWASCSLRDASLSIIGLRDEMT